jgi:multidrug efflux pump subunit AcrA (membrane-fusion protein)
MKLLDRRTLPFFVLGLGLLGAAALIATRPQVAPNAPTPRVPLVRVQPVVVEDVRLTVRTHGEVRPRTESGLVPEVSGSVVWMSPNLVSGGFFEAGEPLLRIDPLDYEVALETARAALARAESDVARAERELRRQSSLAERSWFARSPAISSASRRRWRMPTSSSPVSSATSWAPAVERSWAP